MKTLHIIGILFALILIISGVTANAGYTGYNRYYYTNNYYPSVYYPTSSAVNYANYTYPNYYATTYYAPTVIYPNYYATTYYTPTVIYPNYYAPVAGYSNISIYNNSSGWGISIGRGSVCGYYGYC
ncbi:MAG: hypothetical protein WCW13_05240 [archaeon]|jgi:hypothetical protein